MYSSLRTTTHGAVQAQLECLASQATACRSNHQQNQWCCSMDDMHRMAQRNAMLVHGLDWSERRAGIFEPAPIDELAVATTLGLVLNCLSSGLYMVSSLQHISWRPLLLLPDVQGMHF